MNESTRNPISPVLPILTTVLWVVYMFVVAVIGLFSVMIFDSGSISFWSWLLFLGIWGSVILCPVAIVAGWISWALTRDSGRGRAVRTVSYLLPLLGVLIFAIGLVGTEVACGGNLSC